MAEAQTIPAMPPSAAAPILEPMVPGSLLTLAPLVLAQSITLSAALSHHTEHFAYRFENPSSFDTAELVPHFFEQRYDVVPLWFQTTARYRFGTAVSTSFGVSLRERTNGSDIDTFLQPSGDVVTSGSDGDVMLRSWTLSQGFALARKGAWSFDATLDYRRDSAEFPPDDRIVTHTLPPSVVRTFITDRETTVSQTFALTFVAEGERALSDRWHMAFAAGVQPLIRARLLVRLPDKYPGVDLVFNAISAGATGRWTVEHRARRFRAGITLGGAAAWGYRESSAYSLRSFSVALFAGM